MTRITQQLVHIIRKSDSPVGGGHAPEAKRQPARLLKISTLAEVAGKAASYKLLHRLGSCHDVISEQSSDVHRIE